MTFEEWQKLVDIAFMQSGNPARCADVDEAFLKDAFEAGTRPGDFVQGKIAYKPQPGPGAGDEPAGSGGPRGSSQAFDVWLKLVDSAFKRSGRKAKTKDLDPDALFDAFQSGVSPGDFAKTNHLPKRMKGQKPARPTKDRRTLAPALAVLFLALIGLWIGQRRLAEYKGSQTLDAAQGPVELPVKTALGAWEPKEAAIFRRSIVPKIVAATLAPKDSKVVEFHIRTAGPRSRSFYAQGTVSGPNPYGTVVEAGFSFVATYGYRPRVEGSGVKSDLTWTVGSVQLQGMGEAQSFWVLEKLVAFQADVGGKVLDVVDLPSIEAKAPAPSTREQDLARRKEALRRRASGENWQ